MVSQADVVVAAGSTASRAVRKANESVPIITAFSSGPVAAGLVDSLARPGGNIQPASAFRRSTSVPSNWKSSSASAAPAAERIEHLSTDVEWHHACTTLTVEDAVEYPKPLLSRRPIHRTLGGRRATALASAVQAAHRQLWVGSAYGRSEAGVRPVRSVSFANPTCLARRGSCCSQHSLNQVLIPRKRP